MNQLPAVRLADTVAIEAPLRDEEAGFTLLELLVVIAILGLLAALVGPRLFNVLGAAKSKLATQQIDNIGSSLEMYKLDVGSFPTSTRG